MKYSEAVKKANSPEFRTHAEDIKQKLVEVFPEWNNYISTTPAASFNYQNSKAFIRVSVGPRQHWAASQIQPTAYGHIKNHEALNGMSQGFELDTDFAEIQEWTKTALLAPFNFDPKYL